MTTTDQGEVNASLMGIELATIARMAVVLVNWAMANIGEKREMAVYIRQYIARYLLPGIMIFVLEEKSLYIPYYLTYRTFDFKWPPGFQKYVVLSKIRPRLHWLPLARDGRRVKDQLDRTDIDGDMALLIIASNCVFLHHCLHFLDLKFKFRTYLLNSILLWSYPMDHSPQDPTCQDQDSKRMTLLSRSDVAVCTRLPRGKEAIIFGLASTRF